MSSTLLHAPPLALIGAKALYLLYIWLVWPPRPDSKWKLQGPLPFMRRGREGETVAEARARGVGDEHS